MIKIQIKKTLGVIDCNSKQANEDIFNMYQILKSLKNILIDKTTYVMLFLTLLRIIISLAISYIISLFIIMLYHIYKPSINLFKPFLSIMKSMPVIILTLLIWLIMDVNIGIYIITIFLTTPLIVEALTNGLDNINQDILEYIKLDTNNKTKLYLIEDFDKVLELFKYRLLGNSSL